jgi:hypothetical protein
MQEEDLGDVAGLVDIVAVVVGHTAAVVVGDTAAVAVVRDIAVAVVGDIVFQSTGVEHLHLTQISLSFVVPSLYFAC